VVSDDHLLKLNGLYSSERSMPYGDAKILT
jgi:hypothetical protein